MLNYQRALGMSSSQLTHIFQRGRLKPPTRVVSSYRGLFRGTAGGSDNQIGIVGIVGNTAVQQQLSFKITWDPAVKDPIPSSMHWCRWATHGNATCCSHRPLLEAFDIQKPAFVRSFATRNRVPGWMECPVQEGSDGNGSKLLPPILEWIPIHTINDLPFVAILPGRNQIWRL